ncbi:MAG: choice-of-anchor D domain-containing protein [Gallionella sp.]|nr:choice-of-anchor D domain-containing protein [Gallionella sp.]
MNFRGRLLALIILLLAPGIAVAQAQIQSINPSQGPITGGTQVTLTGSGFTGTTLTLDGTVITPTSASNTQVVFQTPVRENGIASVRLSGNGPTAYAEFLYLPPSLQSLPPGYITTVMGIGLFRGDGRTATKAMLEANEPGFALASDGSLFFSEHNHNVIRRVRTDGIMERYAGTGSSWYSGDGGQAIKAQLNSPRGLTIDPNGHLLVADANNNCIRRIDAATGVITTLYGGQTAGFSGDGGPAANAQFNQPLQIAFDGAGNLYVLEFANRIRKIDTRGMISTIAGNGTAGFSGDGGPATQATFNVGTNDWGNLAADSQGNVYLADTANARVRKIDAATGIITTFVANAGQARVVFTDRDDNLYVGINIIDSTSARILKLSPTGQLLQSWGKGYGFSEDGTAMANAPMCQIHRLVLDHSGNILYADECSSRIRRINAVTGLLDTIAGMGPQIIGEAGSALATVLAPDGPDLLFLTSGDLLVADPMNYRIRQLDQQGKVITIAGNGFMSIGGNDGVPALDATMYPAGIARMPNGDILVDNIAGISRIDSAGIIHAVNNIHQYGFSGDGGPAIAAITNEPWDVTTDVAGNIFIADSNNNRIRRIDAKTGVIDTVVGSGAVNGFEGYGKGSYCGDGGPATQACLNTPYGIAVAPDGTMYIGENGQRVRKVTPDGTISTFFSGEGGSRVRLSSTGNLFMGAYRIQPNGHAFKFVFQSPDRFSNNPTPSGIGDGVPARSNQAGYLGGLQSLGIAIDGEGNLFFADPGNRRVRAIRYGAVMAEPGSTVSASGGSAQMAATGAAFPTALQITLKSPEGTPENGIRIDFAVPTSGASCTFAGGSSTYSALTDIDGHASATCTANAQTGDYSVTATPLALGQSASFSLSNTALGVAIPTVSLNPTALAFAIQGVGTTSASKTVTLNNTGDGALNITTIAATGDYGVTHNCGTGLGAGGFCTLSVTFTPAAAGARSGSIVITSDAASSPDTITLSGTGVAVPVVTLNPTSLTFSTQNVGTTSTAQAIALTNSGGAALNLASIAASGDFAVTNNCGAGLATGGSCNLSVTFTPTAGGNRTGAVTVTSNATGSPHSVGLTGTSPITTRLVNLSTRGSVQTGDNVMIGGFVIGGTTPKNVLIRAVGPNLANYGVAGVLADPTLQLFSGSTAIASNNDWQSANNAADIQATGLAPSDSKESAILTTLNPGAYTAIVSGMAAGTGVGIVEVYELDNPASQFTNISTRGQVLAGDNVMIGGFVIQGTTSKTVLIRAVGPDLANYGVTGVLANPMLQLYSGSTMIASNDDWQTASNAAAILTTGLAPVSLLESAILITLPPGAYTAIVSGSGGGTGVGIVEVYAQ